VFVVGFLVLDLGLLVLAYFAAEKLFRPNDPSLIMGLWIAILVFGLGAFVLRRTRFAAMRLKDIAALKGMSGLLKSLHDTTIQIAFIGGAIALMGFIVTILTGDWTSMLRAAGRFRHRVDLWISIPQRVGTGRPATLRLFPGQLMAGLVKRVAVDC
jgi:hypothetical protein